jgi:hypothetical protein
VESECPDLGFHLLRVDCDEFPCLTVWDATGVEQALDDCPAWAELPQATSDTKERAFESWVDAESESIAIRAIALYPPGWVDVDRPVGAGPTTHRLRRFDARWKEIREELQAELDVTFAPPPNAIVFGQ